MSDTTINSPFLPSAIDIEGEALIKEMEVEQRAAVVDEQVPIDEPEVVIEEPKAEEKPEDRGMERLVTREVELRSKIADIERRESAVKNFEARIKELEAKQLPDDLAFNLRTNPHDTLESMGISPDDLVRRVIAARLGDQVPDKLKEELRQDETQRQIQELKNQLTQRDQAAAARAFVEEVNSGARKYVTQGVGEYAPTVARVAKANPDRVYNEILAEISADARARAAREPNGAVLPYEEAAKRVEARWADLIPALTPASTTAPTTPAQGAKNGTAVNTVKPPDRPLAPWLQPKTGDDDGIKAALQEYRRVEGTGK